MIPLAALPIGRARCARGIGFGDRVLVVLTVMLVSSAHAFAQAPLTLADAQRRAVERSRMVAAQDYAASAARDMAVAAGQLPDPVATLGVDNLPVDGPDQWSLTRDFMTMRSVGVMQEFTPAAKREARSARYEREAEKSLAEKAASVAAIQRDTALAWLDRYYAEAMLGVIAEQSRQAQLEVDAAEGEYRAGRGSLADILAARNALILFDDRASQVRRKVATAKIALARWIGNDADAPLAGKPAIDTIRVDPATLEADLVHHSDVAVFEKKEEMAAADVRVAQADKKADWTVALMYSQRGPAYSNMVSLNVSVPLQWNRSNRQDREVAAKLALLDQARAERDDMLRAHAAEVRAMVAEWENDRERATRYQRELVPLAKARTEAVLAAYRGAKSAMTDVLMARRNEIDVRLQALQLQTDTARLWAQLNFLVPAGDTGMSAGGNHAKEMQ
jgi:outer membrane protein TolC